MAHGVRPATAGWLAFAHGERVLAVATATDEFVQAAWAALRGDDAFQAILDLLTSHGLASTPDFALVEWQGGPAGASVRCIVRGAPSLDVVDATGSHTLSAAGIATWAERTLSDVTALELTILGVTPAPGELPLESGVAALARMRIDLGTEAPAAEPAESAEPAVLVETTEPPEVDVEATMVSAPDLAPAAAPVPSATPSATPAETAAEDESGYDYLFGETMHRSVAEAAVHVPDPEADAAAANGTAPDGIEHDGQTVLTSDVQKLRRTRKARGAATAPVPEAGPRLVLVASPGGTREPLDEPLLVGRSPSVSKVSGGALPRLLTIGGVDQDISRNHVQFTLEGGTVVVTDLHSKNGTSIVLPGKGPQTLRAGEPTAVIVGTVVDLGGGVTFTVEEER
jgi:hypothetical protein